MVKVLHSKLDPISLRSILSKYDRPFILCGHCGHVTRRKDIKCHWRRRHPEHLDSEGMPSLRQLYLSPPWKPVEPCHELWAHIALRRILEEKRVRNINEDIDFRVRLPMLRTFDLGLRRLLTQSSGLPSDQQLRAMEMPSLRKRTLRILKHGLPSEQVTKKKRKKKGRGLYQAKGHRKNARARGPQ